MGINNTMRLVREQDKQELERQNQIKKEIVQSILSGECTIPEDLVNRFNFTYDQAIELFSDQNFINTLSKYSQAKMKMSFYGKDLNKLDEIVKSQDNKEALAAIKLKAQLTQAIKGNALPDVNVTFNLETMVKQEEKQVNQIFDTDYKKVG